MFFRRTAERDLFYCIAVVSQYNKRGDIHLDHTTHCYKLSVILKQEGGMTKNQIKEKAREFNWDVSESDIDSAVNILEKLELARLE